MCAFASLALMPPAPREATGAGASRTRRRSLGANRGSGLLGRRSALCTRRSRLGRRRRRSDLLKPRATGGAAPIAGDSSGGRNGSDRCTHARLRNSRSRDGLANIAIWTILPNSLSSGFTAGARLRATLYEPAAFSLRFIWR